jgi:hypothetical protein
MAQFTTLEFLPGDPNYNPQAPQIKLAVISNVWLKVMNFKNVGDFSAGHKHTFNHPTLLSSGSVEVQVDGKITTFEAPSIIYIEKDKVHRITALQSNTVVSCIHALRDGNETDDIISEDMLPVGISPLGLFQNPDYNLTSIIAQ